MNYMPFDIDIFQMEFEQFESDVHILILGVTYAALEKLSEDADKQLAEIEAHITNAKVNQERLVDEHTDTLAEHDSQTTFLMNLALVALSSRLFMALRDMAKQALLFSPRQNGRYSGDGEWDRLSHEYKERFGFDFMREFVEPMVLARNQIVHDVGAANLHSDSYRAYVRGEGNTAEVGVSQELLSRTVKDSVELVRWVSQRLRKTEIAVR